MVTRYVVSYSTAHEATWEIGRFDDMEAAETAARETGAVGDAQPIGSADCVLFDVADHEDDDDYAIWIEPIR